MMDFSEVTISTSNSLKRGALIQQKQWRERCLQRLVVKIGLVYTSLQDYRGVNSSMHQSAALLLPGVGAADTNLKVPSSY